MKFDYSPVAYIQGNFGYRRIVVPHVHIVHWIGLLHLKRKLEAAAPTQPEHLPPITKSLQVQSLTPYFTPTWFPPGNTSISPARLQGWPAVGSRGEADLLAGFE